MPQKFKAKRDAAHLDLASAPGFGHSLRGLGLNLLVRDVLAEVAFLEALFDMRAYRVSQAFAILVYQGERIQLHADATYHSHPLPSLLSQDKARGAGLEIRLYDTDPDVAAARLADSDWGAHLLAEPTNKPHGLREAYILCPNGYAWVPSRPLSVKEMAAG